MAAITKRLVDTTAPSRKDAFLWDDEIRGFGLKITPAGRRIFILQYRMAGRGTPCRYTIGEYGSLTPAQARGIAADLRHQIAKGTDPRLSKIEKEREAERGADPTSTIDGLIEVYAAKHLSKLKSGEDVRKLLYREVLPAWGTIPTALVTRRDVIELLDEVEDHGGPYARNHATAAIRQMFNWACTRNPSLPNPAVKLPMNVVKERERVLSDTELREIWTATGALVSVFCPFTRVLLLTGQRRSEVAGMSWSEISGTDDPVWTIPASRTKNGIVHEVPLSHAVVDILRQIPRLGRFVFTTDSETPISGFSKFKNSLDNTILTLRRTKTDIVYEALGPLERWTFHDLRRTAATIMAKRGVPPHVVERLLNHVSGTISGVAKIYNRHEYWAERRAAVETLGDYISEIVHR